ncbi:hypothetical protein E3U43_014749, partial [Larimichthys crocea]
MISDMYSVIQLVIAQHNGAEEERRCDTRHAVCCREGAGVRRRWRQTVLRASEVTERAHRPAHSSEATTPHGLECRLMQSSDLVLSTKLHHRLIGATSQTSLPSMTPPMDDYVDLCCSFGLPVWIASLLHVAKRLRSDCARRKKVYRLLHRKL